VVFSWQRLCGVVVDSLLYDLKNFWSFRMQNFVVSPSAAAAPHRDARKERLIKRLPSSRVVIGEEVSFERVARPETYALAKELADAIHLKRCLYDLINDGDDAFALLGDDVVAFSNSFNDDVFERSFFYELVNTRARLEELKGACKDPYWTIPNWLEMAFDDPEQVLLSVRCKGARRPQGFISYSRSVVVDSVDAPTLLLSYTLTLEYIFVSKRMRRKGLGSALIAPMVMGGERDVRYLAKRLNADRFKGMNIRPKIVVAAEVHSEGAWQLGHQTFAIIADSGREAFTSVPNNRFDVADLFADEVYD
jgi:GNAT superfamily N-acetyltransferase